VSKHWQTGAGSWWKDLLRPESFGLRALAENIFQGDPTFLNGKQIPQEEKTQLMGNIEGKKKREGLPLITKEAHLEDSTRPHQDKRVLPR